MALRGEPTQEMGWTGLALEDAIDVTARLPGPIVDGAMGFASCWTACVFGRCAGPSVERGHPLEGTR